jgi:hypothetical protein
MRNGRMKGWSCIWGNWRITDKVAFLRSKESNHGPPKKEKSHLLASPWCEMFAFFLTKVVLKCMDLCFQS